MNTVDPNAVNDLPARRRLRRTDLRGTYIGTGITALIVVLVLLLPAH